MKEGQISKVQHIAGLNMSVRALVKPLAGERFEIYINTDMPEDEQVETINKAKHKIAASIQTGEAATVAENNGAFVLLFPEYNTFDIKEPVAEAGSASIQAG